MDVSAEADLRLAFLALAAHEIRSPLASVIGFADLLRDADFPPDERRRLIGIIAAQARSLSTVFEQVFRLARLDAGGTAALRIETVGAAALATHVARLGTADAWLARVDFTGQVDADLTVDADADAIAEVLRCLTDNAARYAPETSRVRVEAAIETDEAGHWLSWCVIDAGPGFDEATRARAFERFFHGPAAPVPAAGAGLGLSLAQRIVALHGGEVEIEAGFRADAPGARVRLRLPAGRGAAR